MMDLKVGDRVRIAPDVDVIILTISRGRVQMGFIAPKEIDIQRKEIWDQLHAQPTAEVIHANH